MKKLHLKIDDHIDVNDPEKIAAVLQSHPSLIYFRLDFDDMKSYNTAWPLVKALDCQRVRFEVEMYIMEDDDDDEDEDETLSEVSEETFDN